MVFPALGATVTIGNYTVAPDGSAVAQMIAGNVTNLGSVTVNLTFNPAVVHVSSVDASTGNAMTFGFILNIDNSSGFAIVTAGSLIGLSGDVIIANFTLNAVGSEGTSSPLNISIDSFADAPLSHPIPVTPINGTFSITGGSGGDGNATLTPSLVFAITPNSRNAQIGTPVTIFLSVINYGTAPATGVSITQASSLPVTVSYQQWNSTAFIGLPNAPVDMPADSTANFVITIDATSAFDSSSLEFNVSGTNVTAAPIGTVNTLTISASSTPSADVIMMSTSLDISSAVNTATAFALATANVGGASATDVSLVLNVPSTITGLAYQLNETNPDGSIKGPATGLTINVGATPTFAVFLTPTQPIANDPATNRITLQLVDGNGKVIGAQSVAVSTT
ncbi:MAG: hypothetical protein WC556_08475 [Candidatus Methanoperedens sp.]